MGVSSDTLGCDPELHGLRTYPEVPKCQPFKTPKSTFQPRIDWFFIRQINYHHYCVTVWALNIKMRHRLSIECPNASPRPIVGFLQLKMDVAEAIHPTEPTPFPGTIHPPTPSSPAHRLLIISPSASHDSSRYTQVSRPFHWLDATEPNIANN